MSDVAPFYARCWTLGRGAAAGTTVLAGLILLGWVLDVDFLVRGMSGLPATHPLTAICIGLLGTLVYLRIRRESAAVIGSPSASLTAVEASLGIIGIVLCAGQLTGYIAAVPVKLDQVLFPVVTSNAKSDPARMSFPTSLMLALEYAACLVTFIRWKWNYALRRGLLLAVAVLALIVLIGHAVGAEYFYGYFAAVYTAILIGLLTFAVSCTALERSWLAILYRNEIVGALVGWTVPLLVLVLLILCGLHYWLRTQSYLDPQSVSFVEITSVILAMVAVVLLAALKVYQRELKLVESKELAQQLQAAAEESGEQVRAIMATTVDGVITTDRLGRIESFNPGAERLFGYSAAEVRGKNVKVLMPEPYKSEHDGYLQAFKSTGERKIIGIVRDAIAKRKDGSTFPVALAVSEMTYSGKRGFAGIVRDITERKRAEAELKEANQKLSQSNAELEQFAYIASHDLQEPLRKISSYCQLVKEEQANRLDEDGIEYLNVAIDGAERLRTLVRDLLAFSRITTRGKSLAPTSASHCLQAAIENLELTIDDNDGRITSDPLPDVIADESQLTLLFQNLIGNAIKFRAEPPPEVHVGGRSLGEQFEFFVRDNGIGIDPQYNDRIFQIFQRLHNRREYGGTGIGLALCKRIVERCGGKIRVVSTPNEGSTFYFTLQIAASKGDNHVKSDQQLVCAGASD